MGVQHAEVVVCSVATCELFCQSQKTIAVTMTRFTRSLAWRSFLLSSVSGAWQLGRARSTHEQPIEWPAEDDVARAASTPRAARWDELAGKLSDERQKAVASQSVTEERRDDAGKEPFDVLIIGGGAVGLYSALDAASRGLRTALVEADDFGSGNSSTSPKVLHCGHHDAQRALRQRSTEHLITMKEKITERRHLRNTAGGFLTPMPTVVPFSRMTEGGELLAAAALTSVVSLFAGTLRHTAWLGPKVRSEFGGMHEDEKVLGAVVLDDMQVDDAALCAQLALTAAAHGATVLNHAAVVGLLKETRMRASKVDRRRAGVQQDLTELAEKSRGTVMGAIVPASPTPVDDRPFHDVILGAKVRDTITGAEVDVAAKVVINCTGPWSDTIRKMDTLHEGGGIYAAFSSAVAFVGKVSRNNTIGGEFTGEVRRPRGELDAAGPLPASSQYALMVANTEMFQQPFFIVPYKHGLTIVGSADAVATAPRDVTGPRELTGDTAAVLPTPVAIHDARHIGAGLEPWGLRLDEVRCSMTPLLPLFSSWEKFPVVAEAVRRTHAVDDSAAERHLLHGLGATWSSARQQAAELVDAAWRDCDLAPVTDESLALDEQYKGRQAQWYGLKKPERVPPACRTAQLGIAGGGSDGARQRAGDVYRVCQEQPGWSSPIVAALPYQLGEAVFHARHTNAVTLLDVVARRMPLAIVDPVATAAALPAVADALAAEGKWSSKRRKEEIAAATEFLSASRAFMA
jgi:glycerol-3-phosphate dehydrogenase